MSISHLTNDLVHLAIPPQQRLQTSSAQFNAPVAHAEESLRSLLILLKPPLSHSEIHDVIHALEEYDSFVSRSRTQEVQTTEEEDDVRRAVMGRLVVGLYAEAMDTLLKEASEVENEAQWWGDVERSTFNIWHYFVQSTCTIPPSNSWSSLDS